MEMMTLKLRSKPGAKVEVYRSYYLVTDGGRMAGRGRASAVPMSKEAPMPTPDFIEVTQGGEEQALHDLLKILLLLPDNLGLVAEINTNPS